MFNFRDTPGVFGMWFGIRLFFPLFLGRRVHDHGWMDEEVGYIVYWIEESRR